MIERTLYLHQCISCGWMVFRGEPIEGNVECSHCGSNREPQITTVIQRLEPDEYINKRIEKAKEFSDRLERGESVEDLVREELVNFSEIHLSQNVFLHKVSKNLTQTDNTVSIEDLSVKNMSEGNIKVNSFPQ